MREQTGAGLAAWTVWMALTLGAPDRAAQPTDKAPEKRPAPKLLYGHDLRVRPGGVADFRPDTPRIGVEVFQDEPTGAFIAISEAGALAVAKAGAVGAERRCQWLTAHDLATRKAGEAEFTRTTRRFGVELFRDLGANRLLYVCETASVAFAPVPDRLVSGKGPKWHHALELKVRAPEQTTFLEAKRFGMEVFKDENTGSPGNLIYVTQTGGIATAPAPAAPPDPKRLAPPKAGYGMVLRVRGGDEPDFTEKTKRFGVEVFADPNANNVLLYITEAGYVATAPNPGKFLEGAKGVAWKSAVALKARKGGEKAFDKAKKYGLEVFQDNRTGHLVFISETGAIAVLPKP